MNAWQKRQLTQAEVLKAAETPIGVRLGYMKEQEWDKGTTCTIISNTYNPKIWVVHFACGYELPIYWNSQQQQYQSVGDGHMFQFATREGDDIVQEKKPQAVWRNKTELTTKELQAATEWIFLRMAKITNGQAGSWDTEMVTKLRPRDFLHHGCKTWAIWDLTYDDEYDVVYWNPLHKRYQSIGEDHAIQFATPLREGEKVERRQDQSKQDQKRKKQKVTPNGSNSRIPEVKWEESTWTLTFRDMAIPHPNFKKTYGTKGVEFNEHHFNVLEAFLGLSNHEYVRINLHDLLPLELRPDPKDPTQRAELLIVPDGVNIFAQSPNAAEEMKQYLSQLEFDTHKFHYQKVCVRRSQRSMVLADGVEEAAVNGMGNVHDFSKVPYSSRIRDTIADLLHMDSFRHNVAECNHYFNKDCSLGFHGDVESINVCAARFGQPMELLYQAYLHHQPVGERFYVELKHGSLYFMGGIKAVGCDWKQSSHVTFRHSAQFCSK